MSFFFFSGNAALSTPPPFPLHFVKDNTTTSGDLYVFIYLLRACDLLASSLLTTTNSAKASFFIRLLAYLVHLHYTGLD